MKKVAFFFSLTVIFLIPLNCYADPADINLNTGWNLISLSEQPADTNIASALESISGKYISVWAYINGSWKVYDPANPGFSDLTTMEAGTGYWLNMSEPATLTISGSTPLNSIELNSGWNLVGYNFSTSQTIVDALASIAGKYVSVWAYIDGSWRVCDSNNPGFSDLTTMEPGYGYWIYSSKPAELWIENITSLSSYYITDPEENWNIIGIPYDQNVSKDDIIINNSSGVFNWSEAVNEGIINDFVFGWDRGSQNYAIIDMFIPGYSYWLYAYQPCILSRVI